MTELERTEITFDLLGCTSRERDLFARAADGADDGARRLLGRVVKLDRSYPLVCTEEGTLRAEHAVRFAKGDDTEDEDGARMVPCVGDWVVLACPDTHELAIIDRILPRASSFRRKDPTMRAESQVLAANIDRIFVLHALSSEPLNIRRLEREMVLVAGSGAEQVVVLTKADQASDIPRDVERARFAAPEAQVVVTSSKDHSGLEEVSALVSAGTTSAFLGSSGVGKSTLINALIGYERQATGAVRISDGKGRHTTVAREMVATPQGGIIIDMPGIRSVALWNDPDALDAAFPEISAAAASCRFRDCAHEDEPGCGVKAAVEAGEIAPERLQSYHDLKAEMAQSAERLVQRQRMRSRGKR